MTFFIQACIATCSVLLIAIVLDAPKKALPYAALTGGIGWWIYLLALKFNHIVPSTFVGASAIAVLSHIFSRVHKAPTTVFIISALYPFVPGTSVYKAVYALIVGNYPDFQNYALESLLISGAIATAIFMVDSLAILWYKVKKNKDLKRLK